MSKNLFKFQSLIQIVQYGNYGNSAIYFTGMHLMYVCRYVIIRISKRTTTQKLDINKNSRCCQNCVCGRSLSFLTGVPRDPPISPWSPCLASLRHERPDTWYSDDRLPSKLERPRAKTSRKKRLIGSTASLSRSEEAAGTIWRPTEVERR